MISHNVTPRLRSGQAKPPRKTSSRRRAAGRQRRFTRGKPPRHRRDGEKILIAGFGGQGIMLAGRIIAQAAVLEDKNVTYIRSYGAEMRGGTANCLVRVGNGEIASPVFEKASIAMIMNQPSLDRFKNKIERHGLLLINGSMVKSPPAGNDLNLKGLKLNELALELGSIKVANVIGLGLLIKQKPFIRISSAEETLKGIFKNREDLLNINLKALRLGYRNG